MVCVDCDGERLWLKEGSKQGPSLRWSDLEGVAIRTNDSGPIGEDVWWLLGHAQGVVPVPNGADGIPKVVETMQQRLPTFDTSRLIEALGCTEDRTFLLWDRHGRHRGADAG